MDRLSAIAFLDDTYRLLRDQTDLSPDNALVTQRLRDLVATLRLWHVRGTHGDLAEAPELLAAYTELPILCAKAECLMEKWWCGKALASREAARLLEDFWYLGNYRSLCQAETDLVGPGIGRDVVFLGCGALPLSAILLAQAKADARLVCIDKDAEACDMANGLVRALGLHDRITVDHDRAETYPVPQGACVICASLLEAPGLYRHLHVCGAARLLVRDVKGVYRWLYRPATLPGPAFRQCGCTVPSAERINITHYFEPVDLLGEQQVLAAGLARI